MASYFSVIQYVANPVADERVNIGLIVYDDAGRWALRHLDGWSRVERFTGLPGKNFQRHIEAVTALLETASSPQSAIEDALATWTHSVQLTLPRASLRPLDDVLETTAGAVLTDETRASRRAGRPTLARAAHGSMVRALTRAKLGSVIDDVLEPRSKVQGAVEAHDVDLTLHNGKVLAAVRVLSFPAKRTTYIEYEVSDAVWAVEDLRRSSDKPTVAVLVGPPEDADRPDYQRAQRVLRDLEAELVYPDRVEQWARTTVSTFRKELEAMISVAT